MLRWIEMKVLSNVPQHPVGAGCALGLFLWIAVRAIRVFLGFQITETEKITSAIAALFLLVIIYAIFWLPERWKELFGIFDKS